MKTKTRDEWFAYLNEADQCIGKILSLDELGDHSQVHARRTIIVIDDPTHGEVKRMGLGLKLPDTPGPVRHLAPELR